jgi:hypothetical protein
MSPESGKGFWEQDMRQNQEKTRLAGMTRFNVASSDSRKIPERFSERNCVSCMATDLLAF